MNDSLKEAHQVIIQVVELIENYNKSHPYELLIVSKSELYNFKGCPMSDQYLNSIQNAITFCDNLICIGVTQRRGSGFIKLLKE